MYANMGLRIRFSFFEKTKQKTAALNLKGSSKYIYNVAKYSCSFKLSIQQRILKVS